MVNDSIQLIVRRYIQAVCTLGIHAKQAVLFGSHARGTSDDWSDIDVIIVAPELESPADRHLIGKLWELRAVTDPRIEPVPCGEREWDTDTTRPILEIARREGVIIAA